MINEMIFHLLLTPLLISCLYLSVYRNILSNHLFHIKNLCSSCYKNRNIKNLKQCKYLSVGISDIGEISWTDISNLGDNIKSAEHSC